MNPKFGRISAPVTLQKAEFEWISRYLYEKTGIALNEGKQALVMGRLDKRLRANGLQSYSDYFALLGRPGYEDETTAAIDLLTTNETYFFREPKHFTFLEKTICKEFARQRNLRVWSAASSSGEEAYSIALTLAEHFPGNQWEVIGTDISTRVLSTASRGLYRMADADKIPRHLLQKFCLKGKEEYEDFFLIDPKIKDRVHFHVANLVEPLPDLGMFDVIFLRNVMIYFDVQTKKKLVQRLYERLHPGGYFFISHSETLNGLDSPLKLVAPAIYRKEQS